MKRILNNQGFSIIEAMLYLAIVAILLTAVINLHLTLGGTSAKLSSNLDVSRNRRVALSTIEYLIRNSGGLLKDIDGSCSDMTTSTVPAILALYFDNGDYLPDDCVSVHGGGVKLTLDNDTNRLQMTCHNKIENNGEYNACNVAVGDTYYLTDPNVAIYSSNLTFATNTATTTGSDFTAVTTKLSVGILSDSLRSIRATSTATSTVVIRGEKSDGLIVWYKMDDGCPATDSSGHGIDATICDNSPASVTGLVDGSSGAIDFEATELDRIRVAANPQSPNFAVSNSFTHAIWIKPETLDSSSDGIINRVAWGKILKGNRFYLANNTPFLSMGDGVKVWYRSSGYALSLGNTYHITLRYDQHHGILDFFTYQKGVGGVVTTTYTGTNIPGHAGRNQTAQLVIGHGDYYDGIMDDMRIYNRALSDEEIWALQSPGAN